MSEAGAASPRARGLLALWSAWLLGVGAWVVHLLLSYGLVEWYCEVNGAYSPRTIVIALHGLTALSAAMALAGALLAVRALNAIGPAAATAHGRRSRFLARGGLLLSGFFIAAILMQALPSLLLRPCP